MKTKLLLIMIVPFAFLSTLSAQITQTRADSIVMERMSSETQTHTIFAKDGVQTEMTITTANDEIFELDYPCWVYYVYFTEVTNDNFLIINVNNGNLLEIRTESNAEPENLAVWRIVEEESEINYPIIIQFTEYSLEGTLCRWRNLAFYGNPSWHNNDEITELIIINSNAELARYIFCLRDFPEIDFSKYTLLLTNGMTRNRPIRTINVIFYKSAANEYNLNITIRYGGSRAYGEWVIPILVPKIADEATVRVNYQQSQLVGYVANELIIRLREGVDAYEFATSHQGIYPKRVLAPSLNTWLFGTDGTEDLDVLINRLSQDDRVTHVQRNHTF